MWYCGVGQPQCPPLHRSSVTLMGHVTWNDGIKQLCFSTSIYRKETFTVLYNKWDWFTRRKCKINFIRTLTHRCLRNCSSNALLQSALNDLLPRNGYPPPPKPGVITYNMNDFLTRNRNKPKVPITTVHKRDVFIGLPYLGLHWSKFITKQLVTLTALIRYYSPSRTGWRG